jgi:hypothetical protein
MSSSITAWKQFKKLIAARDLAWIAQDVPADLAFEKAPAWAKQVHALLPDDYRRFVAEVGYPMVGFQLYCAEGWSFLPPAALEFHATLCFSADGEEPTKAPLAAFFAAYHDLADITGYAFVPGDAAVWAARVMPRKRLGPFDEWMTGELARLTAHVESLSKADVAQLLAASEGERDYHRLLDYAG